MRIAILTSPFAGFKRVMADGLKKMLGKLNIDSKIFYHGLTHLDPHQFTFHPHNLSESIWSAKAWIEQKQFYLSLAPYDVIVVVEGIAAAFLRGSLQNIENTLRKKYPDKIIACYQNYYLLTRGPWLKWLKEGNPSFGIQGQNHFGLERYDWYLATSLTSEYPLPKIANPCSVIGINIDDPLLSPRQNKNFIALVDFERPNHLKDRKVQLQALEETETEYIILDQQYSVSEIRDIYNKCSLYFIAHRESFGVPICELQASGSYIFTPYSNWCHAHWLKKDAHLHGGGELSSNFIVYKNNIDSLKAEIIAAKQKHNPYNISAAFLQQQPHFFHGSINALQDFISKVESGAITSSSHLNYEKFNNYACVDRERYRQYD